MKNDYRNSIYCPELLEVKEKKEQLKKYILKNHPRQKNFYNRIKDKKGEEYNKFLTIYNYKCAYCGNSILFLDSTTALEIDHFKNENSFDSSIEAGQIDNLVLSCYYCNRGKSDLLLKDKYLNLLYPDDDRLNEIFYRDDMYYIKIQENYKDDRIINTFFKDLKLGDEFRRIDYLLLNMKGLYRKIEDEEIRILLLRSLTILCEKSNMMNKG